MKSLLFFYLGGMIPSCCEPDDYQTRIMYIYSTSEVMFSFLMADVRYTRQSSCITCLLALVRLP